jgi:hypothetical protein
MVAAQIQIFILHLPSLNYIICFDRQILISFKANRRPIAIAIWKGEEALEDWSSRPKNDQETTDLW